LGITGQDAEDYSDALAVGTLDPERSDVLSKIRKDFDDAGVVQSDEQILRVMNELMLQAGNLMPGTRGDALDALAVQLTRKLAEMSKHSANIKSPYRRRPQEERDSNARVDE
jgi:recombinational DNA repair ATPase RecF